jgi:hypothetical protein
MRLIRSAAFAAAIALCAFNVPAVAQTPVVIGETAAGQNILRAGTEINLVTRTELNSRRNRTGNRFELEVSDPVTLNGQVVIPSGSVAVGEVTRRRGRGMWGKRGILETRLLFVRVGDQQIRITGQAGDRGRAGTAGVVASLVVIPVAGFFVTGTSAVIPAGTRTVGYLESDLPVTFTGQATPAGLVVPAQPQSLPETR